MKKRVKSQKLSNGMWIEGEIRRGRLKEDSFLYLCVADAAGDDQIAYCETLEDLEVPRAMRDVLNELLGETESNASLRRLVDQQTEEIAKLRHHLRRLVDHIEVCFFQSRRRAGETCAEYQTRMQGVSCEGCDFCRAKKILGG